MDSQHNHSTEVSKSQLKRDAKELYDLGRSLVDLPIVRLHSIPMEPDLLEAIEFARSINSRVARKRQIAYIARLLRRIDAAPLKLALESMQAQARQINARHHRAEAWRDHLLSGGDANLGPLIRLREEADPQILRQLIRKARREVEKSKPPASARKLFRFLREMDETKPLPAIPEKN